MQNPNFQPVYQLTRGGTVESIHFGAAAAVDSAGRLLASIGDPHTITFMRSTAKPFQALPFFEAGGPAHFGLTLKETALTCASHEGTDDHAATARAIQEKAGISETDLQCGTHPPGDRLTRERLLIAGEEPAINRHNCSGKHSGMLAACVLNGWPLDNYLSNEHPLQQGILRAFAEMTNLEPAGVHVGLDGCSAPNFAVPLYNAALGFARLADPQGLSEPRAAACRLITRAMTAHPDMIAGRGEFDTCLMEVTGGRMISKGGAEGYQGIGILAGESTPRGIGIALKISDGGARSVSRHAFALEILRQLGLISASELAQLAGFGPQIEVRNCRDILVGEGKAILKLDVP